ncbi:MAG: two-component system OmpR family sensor kinase [Bradymonadia bacterium]|jgi:two-component system OmpR family sensor kinase
MMRVGGRLFWRIYRHSLFNLVAIAVLIGAVVWLAGGQAPWRRAYERLSVMLVEQLNEAPRDLALMRQRIHDFSNVSSTDIAIYHRDGTVIVDGGTAPPPLSTDLLFEELAYGRLERTCPSSHVIRLTADTYLVGNYTGPHPGKPLIGLLLAILVMLALLAWPFARSVVRPIEKVAMTARAIGAGDLDARTGVSGKGEMGQLARAIDEMAARIQALRQRERALLADVSHELRTPLARMRVALEWAEEDGELPAPLEGTVSDLTELERLVTDVLNTARLDPETAEFTIESAPFDAPAFIEHACNQARRAWPRHPLSCSVDDGEIEADRHLLERVMANLVSNAARYSDAGEQIEVQVRQARAGWTIQVDDRGMGVDAAHLEQIFEPFFRTDASRARATGGSGLGLTLCRRIVQAHGGTIEAVPRAGGGLSVRVHLAAALS